MAFGCQLIIGVHLYAEVALRIYKLYQQRQFASILFEDSLTKQGTTPLLHNIYKTLASLAFTLNHIFLQDRSIAYPKIEEEGELEQAAEPEPTP